MSSAGASPAAVARRQNSSAASAQRCASLLIVGQEFYEDDDFPNSDFTIVDFLGTRGQAVTSALEKTGTKLRPERVIPASVKWGLEIPETLTVANAPLERIEEGLRRAQ